MSIPPVPFFSVLRNRSITRTVPLAQVSSGPGFDQVTSKSRTLCPPDFLNFTASPSMPSAASVSLSENIWVQPPTLLDDLAAGFGQNSGAPWI